MTKVFSELQKIFSEWRLNNNELELNSEEEMQVDESLNIDLNMNNRGNSGNGAFDELINREKRPLTTSDIELGIIRLK